MLPREPLRRTDVVASSFFMALGAVVIYRASQMPWASARTGGAVQWYLSPGLFPTVIGVLLILFSARVLLNAIREGGHRNIGRTTWRWIRDLPRNAPVHRVVIITLLLGIYVFVGLGRVDYLIASSLFLFITIAIFWWRRSGGQIVKTVLITAAVAILAPLVISRIFTTFLYVPMP